MTITIADFLKAIRNNESFQDIVYKGITKDIAEENNLLPYNPVNVEKLLILLNKIEYLDKVTKAMIFGHYRDYKLN